MENNIKYLTDITYLSELTSHPEIIFNFWILGVMLIRANNLRRTFSASVSYALI